MTERDTQFFESAKLLAAKLEQAGFVKLVNGAMPYTLIAQFNYDLVEHILKQTPSGSNYIRYFKDMTEWPDHRAFADALADLAKIHEKLTQLPELPGSE